MKSHLENCIRADDTSAFYLLRSIPGIGKILALTLFYEIQDIEGFLQVGNFISYARLVPATRGSDCKIKGTGGLKMGNAHLKWAFSEASVLFLKGQPEHQKLLARLQKKHGEHNRCHVILGYCELTSPDAGLLVSLLPQHVRIHSGRGDPRRPRRSDPALRRGPT